jgi:hypothetical protein
MKHPAREGAQTSTLNQELKTATASRLSLFFSDQLLSGFARANMQFSMMAGRNDFP